MGTYNFRIRALDNTGAFADRNFSINVRNTAVDRIVLVDAKHAYSSPDGENWSLRSNAGGTYVTYGNGMWIVAGPSTGTGRTTGSYMYSYDAVSWYQQTFPQFNSSGNNSKVVAPIFCNGRWFVAYNYGSGTNVAIFSTTTPEDGSSWQKATTDLPSGAQMTNMIHDGQRFIAVASNTSSTTTPVFYISTNGTSWAQGTTPINSNGTFNITDLVYVNGTYILSESSNARVWTSRDLSNWVLSILPAIPTSNFLHRLYYGNGRIVAPLQKKSNGDIGNFLTSDDGGITWVLRSLDNKFSRATSVSGYMSAVFTLGGWIMCSSAITESTTEGRYLRTSTDGITFESSAPDSLIAAATAGGNTTGAFNWIAAMPLT